MTTFGFTFDKDAKAPQGKVFARKRKPGNNVKPPDIKERVEITKPTVKKPVLKSAATPDVSNQKNKADESDRQVNFSATNEERIFNNAPKLVKRKHTKDKLAAKAAHEQCDNALLKLAAASTITSSNNTGKTENKTYSLFSEKHKRVTVNIDPRGKSVVEKVFSKTQGFGDLNIHKHLVSNLKKINFTTLTNVQEKSIPAVLSGDNVLIRSQTGSGKTLAYAVPIMDALQGLNPKLQRSDGVQAIIVVPTRELALQTHELFTKINTFQWIVVGHLCGGENRNTEKNRLRKGVHILIATPGRLLDHIMHTVSFKTNNVRCLVLDEADRLLDMGFKKDVVKIVEELDNSKVDPEYDPIGILKGKSKPIKLDEDESSEKLAPLKDVNSGKRQTLLLSATLTKGIAELADFTMKEHTYIDALDSAFAINPEHMVIPNTVKQEFIVTYVKHKLFTLSAILVAKSKLNSKMFVFMATSQMVDYHYELFSNYLVRMPINRNKLKSGYAALLNEDIDDSEDEEEVVLDLQFFALHGSMDQSKRKEVFTGFRNAKKGVLICTDVAARGIDVPAADCIIQYTGPQSDDDYLHRVGRTGRAGKSGSAILFLSHEEQQYISRLQTHKVFLKEHDSEDFLKHLCDLMEEPDHEKAATALQKRYENALNKHPELHKLACFAYTSWSRFYNTYPTKLRSIFDFKKVNLGHYVTSFGLLDTPTGVSRTIRSHVSKKEPPKRLNQKLTTHDDDQTVRKQSQKRKIGGLDSHKKNKQKKFKVK